MRRKPSIAVAWEQYRAFADYEPTEDEHAAFYGGVAVTVRLLRDGADLRTIEAEVEKKFLEMTGRRRLDG